jgi:hypothetical protein
MPARRTCWPEQLSGHVRTFVGLVHLPATEAPERKEAQGRVCLLRQILPHATSFFWFLRADWCVSFWNASHTASPLSVGDVFKAGPASQPASLLGGLQSPCVRKRLCMEDRIVDCCAIKDIKGAVRVSCLSAASPPEEACAGHDGRPVDRVANGPADCISIHMYTSSHIITVLLNWQTLRCHTMPLVTVWLDAAWPLHWQGQQRRQSLLVKPAGDLRFILRPPLFGLTGWPRQAYVVTIFLQPKLVPIYTCLLPGAPKWYIYIYTYIYLYIYIVTNFWRWDLSPSYGPEHRYSSTKFLVLPRDSVCTHLQNQKMAWRQYSQTMGCTFCFIFFCVNGVIGNYFYCSYNVRTTIHYL